MDRKILRHGDVELRACRDHLLSFRKTEPSTAIIPDRLVVNHLESITGRHTGAVTSVAFSPQPADGGAVPFLVTGSSDKSCRLVHADPRSGASKCEPLTPRSALFEEGVSCVAVSQEGGGIVAAGAGKQLRLWSTQRFFAQQQQIATPHTIFCLAFVTCKAAATAVAVGMYNSRILIFDAHTCSKVHAAALHGHTAKVTALLSSRQGSLLFSASADKTVALWDVESGAKLGTIETGHTRPLTSLAGLSPSGALVAVGSEDATITLWQRHQPQSDAPSSSPSSSSSFRLVHRLADIHEDVVSCLCFSPINSVLFSGSFDRCVRAWRIADDGGASADSITVRSLTSEPVFANGGYVRSLSLSPCGSTLAVGLWEKQVQLWCVASGAQLECKSTRVCPVGEMVTELKMIEPSSSSMPPLVFCGCSAAETVSFGSLHPPSGAQQQQQHQQQTILRRGVCFSSAKSPATAASVICSSSSLLSTLPPSIFSPTAFADCSRFTATDTIHWLLGTPNNKKLRLEFIMLQEGDAAKSWDDDDTKKKNTTNNKNDDDGEALPQKSAMRQADQKTAWPPLADSVIGHAVDCRKVLDAADAPSFILHKSSALMSPEFWSAVEKYGIDHIVHFGGRDDEAESKNNTTTKSVTMLHCHSADVTSIRDALCRLEQQLPKAAAAPISVCCESGLGASALFVCCFLIRRMIQATGRDKQSMNVTSLVADAVSFVKKQRPVVGCLADFEQHFKALFKFCLEELSPS